MKLKIAQVQKLHNAISRLNGIERVIKIDGDDKVIFQPFNLSGKARWNIAKNISILEAMIESINKVRNDLINQISDGANVIKADETEKLAKFNAEMSAILETEEEVNGLLKLTQSQLKLDSDEDINQFPPEAIKTLIDLQFIE